MTPAESRAESDREDGGLSAILETRDVHRTFTVRGGLMQPAKTLHAVNGVSLAIEQGEVLGLVGESGCGKSTLANMLLGLLDPSSGEILFDGRAVVADGPAGTGAAIAADLPGPLLVAQPAQDGRRHHLAAAARPRHRRRRGRGGAGRAR